MNFKPTTELTANRRPVDQVVGALMSDNGAESQEAGLKLMASAKEYGLNVSDYLRLAVEPEGIAAELGMDGYEATKVFLGLPTRDDYRNAVTLQAAADAFASYRGVRALFPEVIDDVVQWKYRQTEFETPEALVAQSHQRYGIDHDRCSGLGRGLRTLRHDR